MQKIAILIATLLMGGPAFAADMALKAPPAAAPAPSWTGLYAGVDIGYAWGTSRQYDPFGNGTNSFWTNGADATVDAGYNWQTGRFVLGLEADFSLAHIVGSAASTATWGCGGMSCSSDVQWFATQRGRVGYLATDSLLLYATGGVAEGRIETAIFRLGPLGGAFTNNRTGWTAGAGWEYQFSNRVSWKLEYLHVNFNQFQWTSFAGDPGLTYARFDVIRGGINFKLN